MVLHFKETGFSGCEKNDWNKQMKYFVSLALNEKCFTGNKLSLLLLSHFANTQVNEEWKEELRIFIICFHCTGIICSTIVYHIFPISYKSRIYHFAANLFYQDVEKVYCITKYVEFAYPSFTFGLKTFSEFLYTWRKYLFWTWTVMT